MFNLCITSKMFTIKVFCQWTKEMKTTWAEVWAVGRVRMKQRSSHFGSQSVSWLLYIVWGLALSCKSISPLFSGLGHYLQIESLSVCGTKYYNVVLMVSPGFWKGTVGTSCESHETVSIIWPVDGTTEIFGYRWTGMLPLHGFVFWFGSEVMDPWLITKSCWVCLLPQPHSDRGVPKQAPFRSFCAQDSFLWECMLCRLYESAVGHALCCRLTFVNTL